MKDKFAMFIWSVWTIVVFLGVALNYKVGKMNVGDFYTNLILIIFVFNYLINSNERRS